MASHFEPGAGENFNGVISINIVLCYFKAKNPRLSLPTVRMQSPNKFAKEALPNEYLHAFHAGNVGDVWKHIVLLAVLSELAKGSSPISAIDCYAGAGQYKLPSVGEWGEGIGALLKAEGLQIDAATERYLKLVGPRISSERIYNGSPLLIESLLRPQDSLRCFEINADARAQLKLAASAKTEVLESDGLAGLLAAARAAESAKTSLFALVDPPWVRKDDWQSIPRAVQEAWQICSAATLLLWYPIKSYTRVNAMVKSFQDARIPVAVLDLITTPLEQQKNRLNGSGLLLVNPPHLTLAEISRAGVCVGQACATFKSYWSLRISELAH